MSRIDPRYRTDLTPAQEYKPTCALCPPKPRRLAVLAIKINGVRTDVCDRCWQALRNAERGTTD